jgi:hypothetical protein
MIVLLAVAVRPNAVKTVVHGRIMGMILPVMEALFLQPSYDALMAGSSGG